MTEALWLVSLFTIFVVSVFYQLYIHSKSFFVLRMKKKIEKKIPLADIKSRSVYQSGIYLLGKFVLHSLSIRAVNLGDKTSY